MTKRAVRAALELSRRGWCIHEDNSKEFHVCSYNIESSMRFCPQCGAKIPHSHEDSTIIDLEAAIAAAVNVED